MDSAQLSVPQIIDIILLAVIFITAVRSFANGFFAAVVDLIGNIVGLIAAWILANRWAPVIFGNFFRERIINKTYAYISESADKIDVQSVIEQFTGGLPAEFMQEFVTKAESLLLGVKEPTIELAQSITDTVVGPVITTVITIVLFAAMCSVFSLLASLLAKALKAINHIPVIGFANRLGGFAVGVFAGIINVIIISCILSFIAVITQNSLSFINMEVLIQSRLLSMTSIINPFMG
ncbi:MAG: hypothetical protein IKA10_03995 [Oscillospiraceae bacterium]|nr:hypothetical protein [Oscillospiraceae bacterium]